MNRTDNYDCGESSGTRQVSLSRLISTAFRRNWLRILAAGAVVGILAGGYKVVSVHHRKDAMNAAYDSYETSLQQYNDSIADIDASIAEAQKQVDQKVSYIKDSPRMNLDPYNESWAYIDIVLKIDGEDESSVQTSSGVSTELAGLKTVYSDEINYGQLLTDTAAALNMEPKAFKELISVSNDGNSGSLRVFIRAKDDDTGSQYMGAFLNVLDKRKDAFEDQFGAYTLTVLDTSVITVNATDTATFQSQQQTELSTLQTNITNLQSQKSTLVAPESVQKYSRGYLIREGMKMALAGFIIGFIIAALWFMIRAVNRGFIFTPDEIDGRYGLRTLICFSGRRDRKEKASEDVDYALAQLETMKEAEGVKTVALVGSVSEKRLSALTKMFSDKSRESGGRITFGYLPDILSDANSMRGLRECDGFLLVEEIGRSNYNAIRREVSILAESGKKILGTIYF